VFAYCNVKKNGRKDLMNMHSGNVKSVLHRIGLTPVALFALTLLAPALFGSPLPTCGVASLATYDAAGYECTLGVFTLDDFTFSDSQTGEATLLSDSQIMVDPSGSTPTAINFQFSTPSGFSVGDDQTAEYIVQYQMDPVLPKVTGGTIDLGPNDPVTLTGEFCGNGTLYSAPNTDPSVEPTCLGTNPLGIFPSKLQLVGSGPGVSTSFDFPSLVVTTLDTRLILDLDGPAEVDYFGSTANVTFGGPSPVSSVPEPSTSLLLAPGLLAFVWLRKKWQAR
jgi:hypothetical protein